MESVGELLRRERLRQGLELPQVAERTRINLNYLEAIEAGDTDSLPGAFFYRAFVRQYARLLGLDEANLEPALSELREQAEAAQPLPMLQPQPPPYDVPPMPAVGRRISGPRPSSIILLIAVIVGCSGIYALWQRTRRIDPTPPAPSRVESQTPPAKAQPLPQQTPSTLPPVAAPKPAETPASQSPVATQPSQPVETPKPPAQPPPAEPVPADAKLNIEATASAPVWYSATADGKKNTGVLKEGQTRRFAANERASLFVGNAGGLEIRVNGKPLGPIGPHGQLRVVVITPEGVTITNPREKKEQSSPQ